MNVIHILLDSLHVIYRFPSVDAFGTMIREDFSSKRDKMWYFHVAHGTVARYLSMRKMFNKLLRQI